MKISERIKSNTPLRWKNIMLAVSSICAVSGGIVMAIPSWWIDPELKNFIFTLLGAVATAATWFAQTRVKKV